jgi:glycosyltransferase involved in cell wall biosynthesis
MNITVIVPTFNGAKKLGNIIKALAQQTVKDFELIIAVDGSTDETKALLEKNDFGINYKVFFQENSGRSVIRNNAVRQSSGDLLIFFDDDMRPLPNCIETHLKHHQEYPGSILTGAQIDDYEKASTDFLEYKCWLSRKWAMSLINSQSQQLSLANLHLTAANFSISKALFQSLGCFDVQLRDAEDFDLAIRAHKANISIFYNHNAFAWHDDFVTVTTYIRRLRQYQEAHQTLRRLKSELYSGIKLREPIQLKGIKRIIFSLFLNKALLRLIDTSSKKLSLLPRKVRYKLYDFVTTSYGVFFTDHPI